MHIVLRDNDTDNGDGGDGDVDATPRRPSSDEDSGELAAALTSNQEAEEAAEAAKVDEVKTGTLS